MEILKQNKCILCNQKQTDIVERQLKKGRRYFGSSGAGLTHQISNPLYEGKGIDSGLAKIGLDGEHKTSKLLLKWIENKPNVVLVDSVHLKSYGTEELDEETGILEGGDTDHVLIIGKLVVIIDSKNWKGRRKYTIGDKGDILRGGTSAPFPGNKLSIIKASRLWMNALEGHGGVTIGSIVNITSDKVAIVRDRNWWRQSYRLVSLENLEGFLNDLWEKQELESINFIDVDLVTSVAANALKPYDVYKAKLGEVSRLLNVE